MNWSHICGSQNPADCASHGILPSELLKHELWWNAKRSMNANINEENDENDDPSEIEEELKMVSLAVSNVII